MPTFANNNYLLLIPLILPLKFINCRLRIDKSLQFEISAEATVEVTGFLLILPPHYTIATIYSEVTAKRKTTCV